MKVVEIRSTIVALPRRHTLKTTYGEMPETTTVVVQAFTDEGIVGLGQTVAPAPWYGESAEAIKANIDRYLAPSIIGQNPFDIEGLFIRMNQALRGALYAITAIEYALWDIKGKALGVPVYQLLGGRCSDGAVLHAFVERTSAEETAERVEALAAEGWRWFKTKIGFSADEDVAWYRAVRDRVGDSVQFQLDGNTGYTLGQAVQALPRLEGIGRVALFEQPVRYLDEMAHLAARLETPLQADESVSTPRSVFEIARQAAAHVLHFKIHKFGGLLQAKRMASVAEAAGLEISVAPYFDILAAAAAHLAAATPNAGWPAGASDMTETLLVQPLQVKDQVMLPPEGPGLGIEIDEALLAAHAARER